MGKSTIKQTATVVTLGSASKLYRIGNLRIFQATGTNPGGNYLYEQDRPSYQVWGPAVVNGSDGNLYGCVGRIVIDTAGLISCYCAQTYHASNAGYSYLGSGDTIAGTVVWTV